MAHFRILVIFQDIMDFISSSLSASQINIIFKNNQKFQWFVIRRSSIFNESKGPTLGEAKNRRFSAIKHKGPGNAKTTENAGKSGIFGKPKNVPDIGNYMVRWAKKSHFGEKSPYAFLKA